MAMTAIMAAMRMKTRIAPLACLACAFMVAAPLAAQRPERPTLAGTRFGIHPEVDPAPPHLAAKVVVSFTAPENAEAASFGLHPALKLTKISEEAGTMLTGQRTADGSILIAPATPFVRGQAVHWTFEY